MRDEEEKLEKVCFKCNAYMPASANEPTEYGICLEDAEFEPYVEEILDNLNYDSCRELIERKKFLGEREACPTYQEAECVEFDNDGPLGAEFSRLAGGEELDLERLKAALMQEQVSRIDWSVLPVEEHAKGLCSPEPHAREAVMSTLSSLISLGNAAAFEVLLEFFLTLPTPRTIEEVHRKREFLQPLGQWEDRSEVGPYLIEELYRTPSNNTTRQWIADIFRFLERCPREVVQEPLERMLSSSQFSPKFKRRVEETLFHVRRRSKDTG